MNLTADLAHLIVYSQPDEQAHQAAKRGVKDFIAVTWPVLQRHVIDSGLPTLRTLYDVKEPRSRALLLGYAGHALDFDDFHADFRGHPSTVILPALMAWIYQAESVDLNRFLDAYILGVEVAGRLGLAVTQQHYTLGYHNTASLGTLAAAAALARLTEATEAQTAVLLGIAATQASGLRAQFGSAVKPLHAGLAAERAVSATQLALAEFDGQASTVLEAFIASSSQGQQQPERLITHWGNPWRISSPGLEFKPFATCSGTHSAAEAAHAIREQGLANGESLESFLRKIERIDVAFPPGGDIAASVRVPKNGIEARFSLEYVIAAMLIYNELRMTDFAEGDVNADVLALAAKVHRCPDETAPPDALNPGLRFHDIAVQRSDGKTLRCRQTRQQSLATPVDVEGKLQRALEVGSPEQCEAMLKACELRNDADLTQLTAAVFNALH